MKCKTSRRKILSVQAHTQHTRTHTHNTHIHTHTHTHPHTHTNTHTHMSTLYTASKPNLNKYGAGVYNGAKQQHKLGKLGRSIVLEKKNA